MALASVIILGAIMSILDVTIVNVAIDTLARGFQTSLSTIQWVATGYMLALSLVIPLSGWAMSRFGAKRVWMLAVSLFVIGSMACGLAWSVESLIAFRVLQGFGGGVIMPVGQAVLAQAAGPHRIGRIMSIIGVPMLLGPVIGPVLGGWLVQDFDWRWIFYVNVPVGILALILAARLLPSVKSGREEKLDVRGLVLLVAGSGPDRLRVLPGRDERWLRQRPDGDRTLRRGRLGGAVRLARARPRQDGVARPAVVPPPVVRCSGSHRVPLRGRHVRRDDPAAAVLPGRARSGSAQRRAAAGAARAGCGHGDAGGGPAHRQAGGRPSGALRARLRVARHARLRRGRRRTLPTGFSRWRSHQGSGAGSHDDARDGGRVRGARITLGCRGPAPP